MSIGMHTLKSDYFLTASRNAASGINFMNQVLRRLAHSILIWQSAANQHSELIPGHKHCDVSQGHLFQATTVPSSERSIDRHVGLTNAAQITAPLYVVVGSHSNLYLCYTEEIIVA